MRYSCKSSVEFDLKQHYELRDKYLQELVLRSEYKDSYLRKCGVYKGHNRYRIRYAGSKTYTYAGKAQEQDVSNIREYAFYRKALDVIENNIDIMESFLRIYHSTRAENINELLKGVYKLPPSSKLLVGDAEERDWLDEKSQIKSRYPVFDPESLKVTAFDGTKVRSRAEALLYEAFFIYDIPKVFEFPYRIDGDVLRPDFTILDRYTMTDMIWEHLGNWFHENSLKRSAYRTESFHRWDEYTKLGFFPEQNLLLSFGLPGQQFDAQSIHRKVSVLALPPPDEDTIRLLLQR